MRFSLRHVILAAWIALPAALAAAQPVFAAGGTSWIFPNPVSPNGERIYQLYQWITIPAVIVFLGVEIGLLYIIFRFRRRGPDHVGKPVHGNVPLEIVWFIAPTLIVALIATLSFLELQQDFQKPTDAETQMNITVTGTQFTWFYDYPDNGGLRARDTMVVPTDTFVRLTFESTDVIHSWWVPAISGKTDAVPGYQNFSWLKISSSKLSDCGGGSGDHTQTGCKWHGECAELCGVGHFGMQIDVEAMPQSDFQAWVAKQQAASRQPSPKASPSPKGP